jgi:broad specificity phosphatase PhoE
VTQRFLLVRHCESSGQAADAALTERGLQQAQALAEFLAVHPVDRMRWLRVPTHLALSIPRRRPGAAPGGYEVPPPRLE